MAGGRFVRFFVVSSVAAALAFACATGVPPKPPALPPPPPVAPPPPPAPPPPVPGTVGASVHVALGVPKDADDSDDYLLDKVAYVVSYNPKLNVPNWVAWKLEKAHLGRAPRSPGFRSDPALPKEFYTVKDSDYSGSGYDRGHLCPSADRTVSPAANETTFFLSNVQPQLHELNAGPWEDLEKHERQLANSGKDLYIVAGGLFDKEPKRIGKEKDPARRVAVPKATFKIIVAVEPGQGPGDVRPDTQAIAVIMHNTPKARQRTWTDFVCTIREVEEASGYDFDARVPKPIQDAIETKH